MRIAPPIFFKTKSLRPKAAPAGIVALPVILMLGGLIAEIAIAMAVSVFLLTSSEFGMRLSSDAFFAARAGIQDGILRIVRDKNFTSSYNLTVGNVTADVTVCNISCVGAGKAKVAAVGRAQSRSRKLEAVFAVSSGTGEVRLESLKEVQL